MKLRVILASFLCLIVHSAEKDWPDGKPAVMGHPFLQAVVLNSEVHKVKGLQIAVGHAVFLFEDGQATEIQLGGQGVGFFFRGKGVMDYISTNAMEFAPMTYNLDRAGKIRPQETLSLAKSQFVPGNHQNQAGRDL